MALILYPNDNYDAFIDVATCDAFLASNVIGSQRTAYDALIEADKEIYIRQATRLIANKIELPSTLEDDLQYATAYLVNYSVGKDLLNEDNESNVKIKEIDGAVKTEYFGPTKGANDFPNVVSDLLKQYEYSSSGTFTMARG